MLDVIGDLARRVAGIERLPQEGDRLSRRSLVFIIMCSAVASSILLALFVGFGILLGTLLFGWSVGQSALVTSGVLIVLSLLLGFIERVVNWWTGERWNRIKIAAWIMLPILFGILWLALQDYVPALLISLAAFALLWTVGHAHYKYIAFKRWREDRRRREASRQARHS
jgi:hypothetical protein